MTSRASSATRRTFFIGGCLLVAAGNWPVLQLVNRLEPLVGGLPMLVVYVTAFIPAVMGFLYVAYRKGV